MSITEFKAYVHGIMTAYREAGGSISSAKVLDLIVASLQTVETNPTPTYPVFRAQER